MKRFLILALALIVAFGITPAFAQQASPGAAVSQTGSTGLAASQCLNAVGTTSAQQTITVPSPGGSNAIYFDYISAAIYGTAAIATSATIPVVTTTNIAGTPTWPFATTVFGSTAVGVVISAAGLPGPLGIPIKAQVGTSPTIVGPAAVSTYFQYLTVCFHIAP